MIKTHGSELWAQKISMHEYLQAYATTSVSYMFTQSHGSSEI